MVKLTFSFKKTKSSIKIYILSINRCSYLIIYVLGAGVWRFKRFCSIQMLKFVVCLDTNGATNWREMILDQKFGLFLLLEMYSFDEVFFYEFWTDLHDL